MAAGGSGVRMFGARKPNRNKKSFSTGNLRLGMGLAYKTNKIRENQHFHISMRCICLAGYSANQSIYFN
jgi:hypothetical protein